MADERIARLKRLIENLVDEDKFSGAVLVADESDIVFEQAYGLAEKRFNVPNTIDTIFNLGSLNKLITKTAILQLLQAGKLDLDRPIGAYLTGFNEEILSKVTIRHLIALRSGMGDYFNDRFEQSIGKLRKLDDFVELFKEDPLQFEPGTSEMYSNAGYVVLGKIIEEISGQDYYDYVREHIYQPLGMMHTDHYELDKPIPNLATGYTRHMPDCSLHPTERRNNYFIIGTRGSSAGGGHSTLHDWLKFDRAIAQAKLLDEVHSQMILRPIDADPNTSPRAIYLAGGAPGLTALYLKFSKLGFTVIIFSNYDPEDVEPLSSVIRDVMNGE